MQTSNEICSLEYLIGTLSTAYKGALTALAAKDFCMAEEAESITVKGTILSLPEGSYEASLIRRGAELDRGKVERGRFELRAPKTAVREAKDLQIDIIQTGRHVGTFLLKKENDRGIYSSATELSDELKGIDLKNLSVPLAGKTGLQQKAEEIITKILSTKKDWPAFSERLNGFTHDLFWSAREVFYGAFPVLARFSGKAAEQTGPEITNKPIANFLAGVNLPLEYEAGNGKVRDAVDAWLEELGRFSIDLSRDLRSALLVLSAINARFPDAEIGLPLGKLLQFLMRRIADRPVLPSSILKALERSGGKTEPELVDYSEAKQKELLEALAVAEAEREKGDFRKVIAALKSVNPDLLDDGKMITAFSEAVIPNIHEATSGDFIGAVINAFSRFRTLSPAALGRVKASITLFIEKLIISGRVDACLLLLDEIERIQSPVYEELMMDTGMARAVLRSDSPPLTGRYVSLLKEILIPSPKVGEISSETWAEVISPLHLGRLEKFMDILELGGEQFRGVLIHVTANLFVSGVFIPDDRLFQRRISAYLNSGALAPDFLLSCLFLGRLPVYFHEVGAVSAIRDYSTEIDSWGNDPVLYFVRKQVHVNASSNNVRLIEKVIASWVYNDPSLIRNLIPSEVYRNINKQLFERYSRAIKPFFESKGVFDPEGLHLDKLLEIADGDLQRKPGTGKTDETAAKIILICKLYREIVKKYSLVGTFEREGLPRNLDQYLEQAKKLKTVLVAPEKTAAEESLYFKRHIAFGIPSVLGTYHEPKFDALGRFLRGVAGMGVLLENLVAEIGSRKEDFSAEEASEWLGSLAGTYEIMKLHGIENRELDELAVAIRENPLRISQAADMLRIWQKELAWTVETISLIFREEVSDILTRFPKEDLPEYLMNLDRAAPDFIEKATDIVLRDIISSIPGLVEGDRMIELLLPLFDRKTSIADVVLNPDKSREAPVFLPLHGLSDPDIVKLAPDLGGKAKNLAVLENRGFSVPKGIVLPAARMKQTSFFDAADWREHLKEAVGFIERETGKIFGDPGRPLFLSVRSGSYVSMPGILSSILYCGMNKETLPSMVRKTGDPRVAWDSYRRFIEHYATVVFGLDPRIFEEVMSGALEQTERSGLELQEPDQIKRITDLYEKELTQRGLAIPQDAYEQLRASVRAVHGSWLSARAVQFRRATKTSDHWGTAVLLMEMIPGNAPGSGASVFFTRNPFTYEREVYGDTREFATGDDLVYGRRTNRPIGRKQTSDLRGDTKRVPSLEESDPELYQLHQKLSSEIERAMGGLPQEVEATYITQPDGRRKIFVLQARRMEFHAGYPWIFSEICRMEDRIIGRGTGAFGGALSGVASFARNPEEILRLSRETGLPVILLRTTASTDDVSVMPVIRGIVTASGGVTSHAAVLAQKFGVNAIVGCSRMAITQNERGETFARIGDAFIREGTAISIDGSAGLIFSGACLNTEKSARP